MPPDVSIITPWLDHPQFIEDYERAVSAPGVQTIIIDNGSSSANAALLHDMVNRLRGTYLRNEENRWFSAANNQGLRAAEGRIVLFLNNDISAKPGWLDCVRSEITPAALFGPTIGQLVLEGQTIPYVEGWCVAALREVWDVLGGWDERAFAMPYFEDGDLSLRSTRLGFRLVRTDWPVFHKKNGTCVDVPGVPLAFERNREALAARVRGDVIATDTDVVSCEPSLKLASALLSQRKLPQAERVLARLVETQPELPQGWTLYGQALYLAGRAQAAVEAMERAVKLAPNSLHTLNDLGVLLARVGNHVQAVNVLRRATVLAPTFAECHNNLARSLAELGRFQEAHQAAREAAELSPQSASPRINLSIALRGCGRTSEAVAAAEAATRLDPNSPLALATLAEALAAVAHLDEALVAINEALRRSPDNSRFQQLRDSIVQRIS